MQRGGALGPTSGQPSETSAEAARNAAAGALTKRKNGKAEAFPPEA